MLKRLRIKFIAITMTIVTAMLLVIFGTVYHFTKVDLQQQADTMLENLTVGQQLNGFQEHSRKTQLPYFIVRIYLGGDMQISGYTSYDLMDEQMIRTLISEVYRQNQDRGSLDDRGMLYSVTGSLGVQRIVFLDISGHDRILNGLINRCVLIGFGASLIFFVLSVFLARWAVKPVQTAWDQQKQFISDASHELKTPLTVILSNAELLQLYPENQIQLTQGITAMSHRMRALVEGMLELARSDNGQMRMEMTDLNFSELVEEAVLPFESLLFERNLFLNTQIQEGISIHGSIAYLNQLLGVLLDNAAKYSAPGTVTVSLKKNSSDCCLLCVANPGAPIGKQEQSKIFDRFYRGDAARTGGGSFGLGLPIAKTIVENHKGKIWVQSNSTGNCFCVQLPIV